MCVRPDIKFWTYQIPSSDHTGVLLLSRVGLHNHEQYYQQFKTVAYLKIESSNESVYTIELKCMLKPAENCRPNNISNYKSLSFYFYYSLRIHSLYLCGSPMSNSSHNESLKDLSLGL